LNTVVDRTDALRVGSSKHLPAVLRALGHDPAPIFAAAGVDLARYADDENGVTIHELGRLIRAAEAATGRSDLALLTVDGILPDDLGLAGAIVAQGPDLRTALRNAVRHVHRNTLAVSFAFAVHDEAAVIRFDLRDFDVPEARFVLEGGVGLMARLIQALCGADWRPAEVRLSHRRPQDASRHAAFFGAPVTFGATENALLFPVADLDRPVVGARRRGAGDGPPPDRTPTIVLVRKQVAVRLGLDSVEVTDIAADLGLSKRTLVRRLAGEGVTCRQIVDDVRYDRARHLLRVSGARMTEIAGALGYPNQSSFSRAFRRWAGMPPAVWRRRG
jgi:AraC-like DNA-binding protein